MVRIKKCMFFFGPKFSVFGPKIRFLIWDRDFRQSFLALAVPVVLTPSEAFFDFSFPSYGRFREGTRPTR